MCGCDRLPPLCSPSRFASPASMSAISLYLLPVCPLIHSQRTSVLSVRMKCSLRATETISLCHLGRCVPLTAFAEVTEEGVIGSQAGKVGPPL